MALTGSGEAAVVFSLAAPGIGDMTLGFSSIQYDCPVLLFPVQCPPFFHTDSFPEQLTIAKIVAHQHSGGGLICFYIINGNRA
jgi:hypothetical protein